MTKELNAESFNNELEKYHGRLLGYVRGIIFAIKRNHNLDINELAEIFKTEPENLSDFLHEDWDGHVDSRFLTILYLLADGDFDFSQVLYKKPDNFANIVSAYISECAVGRHDRNVSELFEILGIENDDDLEMAIRAIKETIGSRKKNG